MVVQAEAGRVDLARPPWRDLREWLDLVEGIGELKRVNGASSEEDVGAITEMLERYEDSPCVLFDRLPGFEPGCRVLSNALGTRRRHALTLGLDPRRSHARAAAGLLAWPAAGLLPHPAGRRRRRARPGEHPARRGRRSLAFPFAHLAPPRRRSLHRHREPEHHARSGTVAQSTWAPIGTRCSTATGSAFAPRPPTTAA